MWRREIKMKTNRNMRENAEEIESKRDFEARGRESDLNL
jgi:hypothetical protein